MGRLVGLVKRVGGISLTTCRVSIGSSKARCLGSRNHELGQPPSASVFFIIFKFGFLVEGFSTPTMEDWDRWILKKINGPDAPYQSQVGWFFIHSSSLLPSLLLHTHFSSNFFFFV